MNNGGEAADQMVREALQVTEVAIKLSALGIKNALALSLAYAKENPKVKGKTSLDRLLREGKELKIIALQSKDVGQFKELAKQYGVLFAVVKDKAQNEKVDVMFKAEDVAKLNRIYEQLGYAIPKVTTADRKKDPTRRQSGDSLLTRGKNPLDIDPPAICAGNHYGTEKSRPYSSTGTGKSAGYYCEGGAINVRTAIAHRGVESQKASRT